MLDVSSKLLNEVKKSAQYVTPKVLVRFGDNRFLKNVKTKSSNDFYANIVKSLNAKLYLKFFNQQTDILTPISGSNESKILYDESGNKNAGQIFGSFNNAFPFVPEYSQYLDIIDYDFPSIPISPSDDPVDKYIFYADEDESIPFFFNLNRNLWFQRQSSAGSFLSFASTAFSDNEFLDYAVVECGASDGKISSKIGADDDLNDGVAVSPKNNQGIVFRFIDEKNYHIAYLNALAGIGGAASKNVLTVRVVSNGISSTLNHFDINTGSSSWQIGDEMSVEFLGPLIRVYRNDVMLMTTIANGSSQSHQAASYTLSIASVDLSKATKHGLGAEGMSSLPTYRDASTFSPTNLSRGSLPAWTSIKIDCRKYLSYAAQPRTSGSYVACNDVDLNLNKEATFSFAFKVEKNAHVTDASLFEAYFEENNQRFSVVTIAVENGDLKAVVLGKEADISLVAPTTISYSPPSPFEVGSWYLCTLTIENNQLRLYLDEDLVASSNNYVDNVLLQKINQINLFRKTKIINSVPTWTYFDGSIDEFFVNNKTTSLQDIQKLYKLSQKDSNFIEGTLFFNADQVFNIVEEETYPYNIFNLKNKNNNINSLNGEYYVSNSKININNSYFFASSTSSDENGDFDEDDIPYVEATFDATKVNRIFISTGYELARLADINVEITLGNGTVVDLGEYSFDGNSVLSIDLEQTEMIKQISVEMLSTQYPNSPAILHQINLFYEEDVSEDVISLDFAKIRDNYEATLPIGSTAANNGKITLDNTHKKYNVFNTDSPYYGYIRPHVKVDFSLVYHFEDETEEEVLLADSLFVESWSTSSDSMTVDLDLLDWSVVLQDLTAEGGFVFEDVTAGRAVRDVVRSSGFPSRKIFYNDNFYRTVLADQPFAHWRFNDKTGSVIKDDAGDYDLNLINGGSLLTLGAEPIINHEKNSDIDNNSRTLALLYQITAENVGLESPRDPLVNYSARVDTTLSKNLAEFPLASNAGGVFGSLPQSIPEEDQTIYLDNFSIELVIQPNSFEIVDDSTPGTNYSLISKKDNNNLNYNISIEKNNNTFLILAKLKTDEDLYVCSHEFSNQEFFNKVFHIVFTKTNEKISLYVNGEENFAEIEGFVDVTQDPLRVMGVIDEQIIGSFISEELGADKVYKILQHNDNFFLVGDFFNFQNKKVNCIVKLNNNGVVDESFFYDPQEIPAQIADIVVYGNNIYILEVSSLIDFRVVKLNFDGSIDESYNHEPTTVLKNIAVQNDGKILAYGRRPLDNAPFMVRLTSSGAIDSSFNFTEQSSRAILDVKIASDGSIFAASELRYSPNTGDSKIIKINSDGSVNQSFNAPVIDSNSSDVLFDFQDDGKILAGYSYGAYRLNTDGSLDITFSLPERPAGTTGSREITGIKFIDDDILIVAEFGRGTKIFQFNSSGALIKETLIQNEDWTRVWIDNNFIIYYSEKTFFSSKIAKIILNAEYVNNVNLNLSHIVFYNRKLNINEIQKHYISLTLEKLSIFPYLYFFDTTYWDGILEIATADIGMFYFNENNNFVYDHKNAFHDFELKNSSEIQYTFKPNKNIINANYVLDIEANKIIVKVNPKSKIASAPSSLWRAESGESLAVTSLARNLTASGSEIYVANTENPIWPRSGYLKIDNEIIKYNNREINKFLEIERGYFDTSPTAHNANSKCREARLYEFEFSEKPAISVQYPFLVAQIFEDRANIDKFETTPFGGTLVVSASTSADNDPSDSRTGGNLVYLEGTNPINEKEYFLAISGVPLTEKVSEERVKDEVRETELSERRLRPRELVIDNKFIQTTSYARDVVDFVLTYFGKPVPVIQVESIGLPFLQLGDLIKIEDFEDMSIETALYWIIETSISYDGGIRQSFTLRKNNNVI